MYLTLVLAFMVSAGLFANVSFDDRTQVVQSSEHGGKIGLGLDKDEMNTRSTDLRPQEVIDGSYVPDNWVVSLNQTFRSMTIPCHPVGSTESPYGDALFTSVNDNLTIDFSSVQEVAGSNITNVTVNWGDGSGNQAINGSTYVDTLQYQFTHAYAKNGTYTLQAWFWHYNDAKPHTYTWTYGAWPVVICDGYIEGYANYSDTNHNLLLDDGSFPLQNAFNDSVVFQMPRGTTGVYDYDPTTGQPREGKTAYTDDQLASTVYLALQRHTGMFRMIDDSFQSGSVMYFTFGFNAPVSTINMWKADSVAVEPVENSTDNLSANTNPALADTMLVSNATEGIQNLTLQFYNNYANAWASSQYDFQAYSDQIRPMVDLYIANMGGGTTTDQKITADEAQFALSKIDEAMVENWLGFNTSSDSSGYFWTDGLVYQYVSDSIVGTQLSAQGWYDKSPFQLTIRATYNSDQVNTTKTTHTVTIRALADTDDWNRTYTLAAPAGWEIVTVTPLDTVDANGWSWDDSKIYIDAGDANDDYNVLMQKVTTTAPDEGTPASNGGLLTQTFLGLPIWVWALIVLVGGYLVTKRGTMRRRY